MEDTGGAKRPKQAVEGSKVSLVVERVVLGAPSRRWRGETERGAVAEAFQYLKSLWHPNVCCYTDMLRVDDGVYVLISEGYSLTLDDLIMRCAHASDPDTSALDNLGFDFHSAVCQIACGIQYLHAHGIEHGALGPQNVFIQSDGTAKIGCYAEKYLKEVALSASLSTGRGNTANVDHLQDGGADTDGSNRHPTEPCDTFRRWFYAPEYMGGDRLPLSWSEAVKNDVWGLGITCLQCIGALMTTEWPDSPPNTPRTRNRTPGSLQMYNEMVELSQCVTHSPWLNDAFAMAGSLLNLANDRLRQERDVSAVGLDVLGVCSDHLFPNDRDATESTREMSFAQLADALLSNRGTLQAECCCDTASSISSCSESGAHSLPPESQADQTDVQHGEHRCTCGTDSTRKSAVVSVAEKIINWCTGRAIVSDAMHFIGVDLEKGHCDPNRERLKAVQQVYHIFAIAHQCLILNPQHRRNSLDLLALLQRSVPPGYRESTNTDHKQFFKWTFICQNRTGTEYGPELRMPVTEFFTRSYRHRYINLRELDTLELHVDDLFYFWRLTGNDPLDFLEDADYFSSNGPGYVRKLASLSEMLKLAAKADLFPMIIEHQIRPTCAYARQFSFLYQWLRVRRFDRLLSNGTDSKHQISTEAQLDVPPLLRKHIWCVLLGVTTPFGPPLSDSEYEDESFKNVADEMKKTLRGYDNDLLHSQRCLRLMAKAGGAIRRAHDLESLSSSIYTTFVPLVLLYYDFSELFLGAVTSLFDRYLKHYYVPSGSFVQNELEEFNTMLKFFDPEVAAHLKCLGAFADSFALLWFMSLFAETASCQQLYVLWDTILNFPRSYVKYLAVGIIHSARDGILRTTTAPGAISYISSLIDTINAPMLNSICTQIYSVWDPLLYPKDSAKSKTVSRSSSLQDNVADAARGNVIVLDIGSTGTEPAPGDACSIDRNMFTFNTESYPRQRCFKLALRQFVELLDACVIVDLRPVDSYKLGHIPNSCHIDRLFACLEKQSDAELTVLVTELMDSSQPKANGLDPNRIRKKQQLTKNCEALLGAGAKTWSQERQREPTILLAAGDGMELESEMRAIERLIFDFYVPHVCYYRINADDWPKFFTLSQM
ncbi:TBC domain-containing kinase [Babesia caballi]|uniref:TBC1 domain family member 7 n=1 Tax=Babesia caballi TaxID=5871 RepID=A0AAV4LTF0_BABCB|nr:TBC domain-containing kinase [Babesia caballi]